MLRKLSFLLVVAALWLTLSPLHSGEKPAQTPYGALCAKWKADKEALKESSTAQDEKLKGQEADLKSRYTKQFVQLAKRHASDEDVWLSCLIWVVVEGSAGDDFDAMIDFLREHAGDLRHTVRLQLFLSELIRSESDRLNPALRQLSEGHPSKGVRGAALYALAARAKIAAERAGSTQECAEAESLLRRVVAEYPDVRTYRGKNEDNARELLEELRSPVSIGKVAPETVGPDLDGGRFNLASTRGKVVVVSFSGHWCTPCRAMHPVQKKLLERFSPDDLAMVEINSDNKEDKEKVAEKVRTDGLGWHMVLDGPHGPISKEWHVSAWPTFYVLDRSHKIRRKAAGNIGEALIDWVDGLIAEGPE
ncbi:MAG: TlpA family protein disulfide reductase [Planctomycetota bacterium]|jgi:thiol-disulfide isomerase/thioredoxin